MRGLELQLTTKAQVIETAKGQSITIKFSVGPFSFFIISGLPKHMGKHSDGPLVYVKVNLIPNDEWPVFKDHDELEEGKRQRGIAERASVRAKEADPDGFGVQLSAFTKK